jgi:hypothetical protein
MTPCIRTLLIFSLAFASGTPKWSGSKEPAEIRPFLITFSKNKVRFSGTLDRKETADELANAIVSARPDLQPVNSGIDYHPDVSVPDLKFFKPLAIEVALSTHQGEIEVSDDLLLIGGLTDSIVAASVLRLRAKPLLENRRFLEQLCLVPTEDLPAIPIVLSSGDARAAFAFDLSMTPVEESPFQTHGILLTKLLDLVEHTSDVGWLQTGRASPPGGAEKEETTSIAMAESRGRDLAEPPPSGMTTEEDLPAATPDPFLDLGPVLFVRNGFVLQAGQEARFATVIKQLNSAEHNQTSILIRAQIYPSGSVDFASWLGDRRIYEVHRRLTSAGVPAERIRKETAQSQDEMDRGEVSILIPKPEASLPVAPD